MAEDSLTGHVAYLENEVNKLDVRVHRLEAILSGLEPKSPGSESPENEPREREPQKRAIRERIASLRNEASEHRKYLALVKPGSPTT